MLRSGGEGGVGGEVGGVGGGEGGGGGEVGSIGGVGGSIGGGPLLRGKGHVQAKLVSLVLTADEGSWNPDPEELEWTDMPKRPCPRGPIDMSSGRGRGLWWATSQS